MSGGGKGPSSSGNITQTTSNKTADTLLPYQQGGWDAARYTFDNNPTPPAIAEGYDKQYDIAKNYSADLTGDATGSLKDTLTGGMGVKNSPSYGTLNDLQSGVGGQYGTVNNAAYGTSVTGDQLKDLAYTPDSNYRDRRAASSRLARQLAVEDGGRRLPEQQPVSRQDLRRRGPRRDARLSDRDRAAGRFDLRAGRALRQRRAWQRRLAEPAGSRRLARRSRVKHLRQELRNRARLPEHRSERSRQSRARRAGQQKRRPTISACSAKASRNCRARSSTRPAGNTRIPAISGSAPSPPRPAAANDLLTGYNTGNSTTNTALGLYPGTQKETFYPATQMTAAGQGLQKSPTAMSPII
jgi:hypothetical protein